MSAITQLVPIVEQLTASRQSGGGAGSWGSSELGELRAGGAQSLRTPDLGELRAGGAQGFRRPELEELRAGGAQSRRRPELEEHKAGRTQSWGSPELAWEPILVCKQATQPAYNTTWHLSNTPHTQ